MPTPSASYDWIREIQPELKALDAIPLTGASPPFPWDQLSSLLAKTFDRDSITIQPGEIGWRTKDQLFDGLGNNPFSLTFSMPSLKGNASWVMPEQEMSNLESLLLTKEAHPINFNDRPLSEAFYRFLAIEVLYSLGQMNFDKSLVPILTGKTDLPKEDSLCWDISITILKETLWGRLIISPELRLSWVEHFAKAGKNSVLTQEMTKKIEVLIDFEAGRVNLSHKELSTIKVGDWIALDSFSLDPDTFSGRVMLTVNGKHAFVGQLNSGNVKILELPTYHEV